jgi:CcmD family protein
MSAVTGLIAANVALWIGLGLYMAFLASSQKRLKERIDSWENEHD